MLKFRNTEVFCVACSCAKFWLIITLVLVFTACDEEKPEVKNQDSVAVVKNIDTNFALPTLPAGRAFDSLLSCDITGDGKSDYVVLTRSSFDTTVFKNKADHIDIYTFDSIQNHFFPALTDDKQWIVGVTFLDVTGDNKKDVIVTTSSGGNDEVASNGLAIYSTHSGSFQRIYSADDGSPSVRAIGNRNLILIKESYCPEWFAHIECFAYISELLDYRTNEFVSVKAENKIFFSKEAERYLAEYSKVRFEREKLKLPLIADKPENENANLDSNVQQPNNNGIPQATADSLKDLADKISSINNRLLALSVVIISQYNNASAIRPLRAFWASEKDFLEANLEEEKYKELVKKYSLTVE